MGQPNWTADSHDPRWFLLLTYAWALTRVGCQVSQSWKTENKAIMWSPWCHELLERRAKHRGSILLSFESLSQTKMYFWKSCIAAAAVVTHIWLPLLQTAPLFHFLFSFFLPTVKAALFQFLWHAGFFFKPKRFLGFRFANRKLAATNVMPCFKSSSPSKSHFRYPTACLSLNSQVLAAVCFFFTVWISGPSYRSSPRF